MNLLPSDQDDTGAYQQCRQPSMDVYIFVQEKLRRDSVTNNH